MGRRGPGALPQAEKREQYARLIAQGYSNSEACRIVGSTGGPGNGGDTAARSRPVTAGSCIMLPWLPRGRAGVSGRSRTGTCLSRRGCGSPICARRDMVSGRSRSRRAGSEMESDCLALTCAPRERRPWAGRRSRKGGRHEAARGLASWRWPPRSWGDRGLHRRRR